MDESWRLSSVLVQKQRRARSGGNGLLRWPRFPIVSLRASVNRLAFVPASGQAGHPQSRHIASIRATLMLFSQEQFYAAVSSIGGPWVITRVCS